MNAGSIIGSPLKTADGVTFVTLGRLAPQMATHNDKPTLEIQPHTQPAMPPKSATPGTSSSQQPSVADPTFTPQPTHTLSVRRKPNGNGGWTVPPRILLVDDDSVYRDLSGKLLQVIGCTIDLAKDGVEAIKKMGLEKYDLILMVSDYLYNVMIFSDGWPHTKEIGYRDAQLGRYLSHAKYPTI